MMTSKSNGFLKGLVGNSTKKLFSIIIPILIIAILGGLVTLNTKANTAPFASFDYYTTKPNTTLVITPLSGDYDVNGDTILLKYIEQTLIIPNTIQSISVPNGLVVKDANGNLTFVPDNNYFGEVVFEYRIIDSNGTISLPATQNISIKNRKPLAVNDYFKTGINTPINLNLLAGDNDPDGDVIALDSINNISLTPGITQLINVPNGIINIAPSGVISFAPNAVFVGSTTFPYSIKDQFQAQNDQSTPSMVNIAVLNGNPIANPKQYTTQANTPINLNLMLGTVDPDGDSISLNSIEGFVINGTAQTIQANGSISGNVQINSLGNVVFEPAAGYTGTADFFYTIKDSNGLISVPEIVEINVNTSGNPIPTNDNYTIGYNSNSQIYPLQNDLDPNNDSFAITKINNVNYVQGTALSVGLSNFTVNVSASGVVSVQSQNFDTPGNFSYQITDSNNNSSVGIVYLVPSINQKPIASPEAISFGQNSTNIPINTLANDADPESSILKITKINNTNVTLGTAQSFGGSINGGTLFKNANEVFYYVPNPIGDYTDLFTYQITDEGGKTADSYFTLSKSPNQYPTPVSDYIFTTTNNTTTVNLISNDSDPDQDPIRISKINNAVITSNSSQSISVNGGTINYTNDQTINFVPNTNFAGISNFVYSIIDSTGKESISSVTVQVRTQNIQGINDSYFVHFNNSLTIDPVVNDINPNGLALFVYQINNTILTPITQSIPVNNGTLSASNSSLVFVPNNNFVGITGFNYKASDGFVTSPNIAITITSQNNAPTAIPNVSTSGLTNSPYTITVPSLFSDPDTQDIPNLKFSKIANVSLIYSPNTTQNIPINGGQVNVTYNANNVATVVFVPIASLNAAPIIFEVTDGIDFTTNTITLGFLSNSSASSSSSTSLPSSSISQISSITSSSSELSTSSSILRSSSSTNTTSSLVLSSSSIESSSKQNSSSESANSSLQQSSSILPINQSSSIGISSNNIISASSSSLSGTLSSYSINSTSSSIINSQPSSISSSPSVLASSSPNTGFVLLNNQLPTITDEDESPNNGDGNNDGIKDSTQDQVISIKNPNSNTFSTMVLGGEGDCKKGYIAKSISYQDQTSSFPFGLVDFSIKCNSTSSIKFYWHGISNLEQEGYRIQKIGNTSPSNDSTRSIYVPTNITNSSEIINGKMTATTSFALSDGMSGDDTSSDGIIKDPIGPSKYFLVSNSQPVNTIYNNLVVSNTNYNAAANPQPSDSQNNPNSIIPNQIPNTTPIDQNQIPNQKLSDQTTVLIDLPRTGGETIQKTILVIISLLTIIAILLQKRKNKLQFVTKSKDLLQNS